MNTDSTQPIANQEYTVRHLIPANILQAKELMLVQLNSLKSVIRGSTRDRVSQTGFFLGSNSSDSYKVIDKNTTVPL